MGVIVYFTQSQFQKKVGLNTTQATKIWAENYYSGWKHWLTLSIFALTLAGIYLLSLPSWSWLNLFVFIHIAIATPIASKNMNDAVKELQTESNTET